MSMLQDCLIIGTDNGVGKTLVTCALLRDLRNRGYRAMGYKPICCGDRAEARAFRDATEPGISLELINPLYLRANADPYIAAELQRVTIKPQQLVDGYRKLKDEGYGPIIVEGIGGWNTPIADGNYTMSRLAQSLGLPVLLVTANRQGAAALTSLVVNDMDNGGTKCHGIILNNMREEWDTAAVTNRQLIEKITHKPVLAELIYGQEELSSDILPQGDGGEDSRRGALSSPYPEG